MEVEVWVGVSFGVPVLEEPGVHGRFGFQSFVPELEPKTAVNSWLFQDRNPKAHVNPRVQGHFGFQLLM